MFFISMFQLFEGLAFKTVSRQSEAVQELLYSPRALCRAPCADLVPTKTEE